MRRVLFLSVLFAVNAAADLARGAEAPARPLAEELEALRARYHLPAVAAASIRGVKILESAAVGLRREGGTEKVTIEDRWHLGSCTKSMTATIAAMLVESGTLNWSSTVGAAFPEWKDTIDPGWAGVTLEQLLTHRGGAPAAPPSNLWRAAFTRQGTPESQREQFVKGLLLRRPVSEPGKVTVYSNQGYAIAGVMMERAAAQPWEKLMNTMLFPACVMPNAGFGPPASAGKVDHPWGHLREGATLVPVPPGPAADNPPAIAPAGLVHCTIEEFARYAAWHARGDRSGMPSMKRESFEKLHTPPVGEEYAMGWIVVERSWAGGKALMHNGSNTMFYAVMWLAPEKGTAFVAATNCAGAEAAKACDEAVSLLIGRVERAGKSGE